MGTLCRKAFPLLVILALLAGTAPGAAPAAAQEESASAAAYPGWVQRNASGFGGPGNFMISALETYGGYLYAGTWRNPKGQVWRSQDGKTWKQFSPAFSLAVSPMDMAVFKNRLYVAAGTNSGATGELWRTNGSTWQKVAGKGLGDANNVMFRSLAVFGNSLYLATGNEVTGTEIWRSASGDPGSWVQVNVDGFGGPTVVEGTLQVFGGKLFAGIGRTVGPDTNLSELWYTSNGTQWQAAFTDGLGDAGNSMVSAMEAFEGWLYLGLRNTASGGQLWRSENGLDWDPVFSDGLGEAGNGRPYGLIAFEQQLFLVFSRPEAGGSQVWVSNDGELWRKNVSGGWGDPNNLYADYFDKSAAVFNGSLYIGTGNQVSGGQIWMQLHQIYLPLQTKTFGGALCNTKPTLLFPANGSQIDNLIPVYKFNLGNDPAADGSRLQIARDPGFTQVVSSWWMGASTGVKELMDIENLEPSTTYYWRVFLRCGNGQGPYSNTWSFKSGSGGVILPAPTLLSPPNGSLLPGLETTLKWSAVNGSQDYLVHLFNRTQMYILLDRVNGTQEMAGLDPGTHYSWWIYPRNAYAYGNSSAEWFFDSPGAVARAPLPQVVPGYDMRVGQDSVSYYLKENP